MHKHLSKLHRRIGISAALIAIYLSISGLMLNHSYDLGLDNSHTSNSWLLQHYGIQPLIGVSTGNSHHKVDKLGNSLFIDKRIIGQYDSNLVGAVSIGHLYVIALKNTVLLLTDTGEILETLTRSSGLPGKIERVGIANQSLMIESAQQLYKSDNELLNWLPVNELRSRVSWSLTEPMTAATVARIKPLIPAYGPSWERIIQDLHSGRFFKLPGTLIVDLTGVVILLLSISGIVSFTLRKKAIKRKKESLRVNEQYQ